MIKTIENIKKEGIQINTIYNADCLEALKYIKDNSIDLVLTDPPYNISRNSDIERKSFRNPKLRRWAKLRKDFGEWDKFTNENFDIFTEKWIKESARTLKANGTLISYFDKLKLNIIVENATKHGFKTFCPFAWVKSNPPPQIIKQPASGWEAGVICCRSKYTFNKDGFFVNYFYRSLVQGKERTKHPTQKPLDQIGRLIEKYSNFDDIVLDPFIGSGTTAVACKQLNRKYIGIEISPEYCKVARKRVKNTIIKKKIENKRIMW